MIGSEAAVAKVFSPGDFSYRGAAKALAPRIILTTDASSFGELREHPEPILLYTALLRNKGIPPVVPPTAASCVSHPDARDVAAISRSQSRHRRLSEQSLESKQLLSPIACFLSFDVPE